jgi:uncharacterized protein YaeQ
MALKSTIHKVRLTLSNFNIHHYENYTLTVAKHPSENDLRMMIRLLAFSLSAHEELQFTKGLSSDSEPDIWKINHDGSINHWIELGIPEEKRLRQICSKAEKVSIYTYHGNQAVQWFEEIGPKAQRFDHLNIIHFKLDDERKLESFAQKGMDLVISIEDDDIWISNNLDRECIHIVTAKKSIHN